MMLTIDTTTTTTTDVDASLLERQVDYLAGLVGELLAELSDHAA